MKTRAKNLLSFRNLFAAAAMACALGLAGGTARAETRGIVYLLGYNVSGNHIYAYWVNDSTGDLTAVSGFPILAGGSGGLTDCEALAIDRSNNRVYVANDNQKTMSAFSIAPVTGLLTAMPFSPVAVGGSFSLGSIAVHPSGSPVVIGSFGPVISSFAVTSTTATAATGSPYTTPSKQSLSLAFSPDGINLYGGGTDTTGSAFAVNSSTGVLATLGGSSFAAGSVPVGLAVDTSGRLFLANFNSNTVRAFDISAGNPADAAGNPFTSGVNNNAGHGIVHPAGYYIVSARANHLLGVFRIAGSGTATTLTAVAGSPFAAGGTSPGSLALNDADSLVLSANSGTGNVTSFSIDTATGALSALVTQPAGTIPDPFILGMAYTTIDMSVPMPPVTPTVAPTVAVTGKKKIATTKSKWKIKGTTSGTVASVKVKQGKKTKTAKGTAKWSYKAKLLPGKNVLTITAIGPNGTSSEPVKVTITRR